MAELTAEMIVDLATPKQPDISPDGRTVVYALTPDSKKEEHGTSALWLVPVDGSRHARQFTAGSAEDHSPRWSPDGSQIAFLSDRATRGTAQLYVITADGGEARALTDVKHKKAVEQFAWSPRGGQIAFTSADEPTEEDERREKERDDADVYGERLPHARLRLLSLASGEVSTLVSGDYHVDDFAWSPDGTELAYILRKAPSLEYMARDVSLWCVPVAGGEPRQVCRLSTSLNSLAWTKDGQTLLFGASVSFKSQSSQTVYAVLARGGEPRRLAAYDEGCLFSVTRSPHAQQAAVIVTEGLESRICWLDTETGALTPLSAPEPEELTGDMFDWTMRTLEDGTTVLAIVRESAAQPGEIWAGRAAAGERVALHQLTQHQSGLSGLSFGPQEAFTWTAPDGWQMDGMLVRPPDAPRDRPLPTIVLVHGGPYGRWGHGFHLGWADWAQWLALAGYVVLMPNPRGGYGHGERFAGAARGDVGGADYADVMSALDAAIERGIADPERLGIGGWSQGGFMTAWAVTQTSRFKAAIMGAGVSDWGMMAMTSDIPDFERELGGSVPWDGLEYQNHLRLSPISFARDTKTPVLILHGEKDARVPLTQAIGFHRALRQYGVPTELVVYPREGHPIREHMHQLDLLRRVRSWYDRWLRS